MTFVEFWIDVANQHPVWTVLAGFGVVIILIETIKNG